jgi:two-component system, NtrC family, C4-dicarboxylate transport sensor histidine kinase DctB
MNLNDLQLNELRRFAELGRLSATLIHEISNPLSAALLNLEMSDQTSPTVRKARRNMQVLRRYVDSVRQQISSSSQATKFSLSAQLGQLKRVLTPIARQAGVKLMIEAPLTSCKLYGDAVKFQQVVANLVINAIQAYEPPVHPQALVKVRFSVVNNHLLIEVSDWGKGIAPSELPKIFDPFYTTKGHQSQGLGIGLAIVKQNVIGGFSGSIKVASSRRLGTRFRVKIPLPADEEC